MGSGCSDLSKDATPKSGGIDSVCLNPSDIESLPTSGYSNRDHGRVTFRSIISSDRTPTNSMSAGIATCTPKRYDQPASSGGNLAQHRHWQAVIWIIQSGEGIVNVDMVEHKVQAGSVVFIPGHAEHGVRNDSVSEDLVWYYCYPTERIGDVRMRFTNDQGKIFDPMPR
ncbi:hypothetical protein LTR56_011582 [Elasticomyces elasticus]|nr:hypothetical protein LTR56_011582 [Elasticomyces elasticus]KAK3656989.1 hypothetical protein LTR22_009490 [Elasticomyces elasticus]KAK4916212.1 hypothetical protein LTR49_015717 [Elasticomyces elasticus]KAK5764251.1 hypothetical protein LTS12_005702 [Elasticomyces elasticus]